MKALRLLINAMLLPQVHTVAAIAAWAYAGEESIFLSPTDLLPVPHNSAAVASHAAPTLRALRHNAGAERSRLLSKRGLGLDLHGIPTTVLDGASDCRGRGAPLRDVPHRDALWPVPAHPGWEPPTTNTKQMLVGDTPPQTQSSSFYSCF